MPTVLSDPPPVLLTVATLAALLALVVWLNRRDRPSLVALLLALIAAGLLLVCDRLCDSPREEAVRAVREMVTAADTADPDRFVAHLAETFEYRGEGGPVTLTREQIRRSGFWEVLRRYRVHVAAWDFSRNDVEWINPDTVEIGFLAKGEADGRQYPVYLRARFARQPDGRLRLVRFASFDPLKRQNEPRSIPYFP